MTPQRTGEGLLNYDRARLLAKLTFVGRFSLLAFAAFAFLLAGAAALAEDDTKVAVSVAPNPVALHESLQLKVEVDSPATTPVFTPTFDAPDFSVMGSGFENSLEETNGVSHKTTGYTYVLVPKRAGEFTIRNIQVKIAGTITKAPDQKVQVTGDNGGGTPDNNANNNPNYNSNGNSDADDSANPAAPNYNGNPFTGAPRPNSSSSGDLPSSFNSDFTVFASVAKHKAYVGEPIVVEYNMFDYGGLRQMEITSWPTFSGFWKDDLQLATRFEAQDIYVKNQEMRKFFLARYALYGIKPGRFNVDKLGVRGKYMSNDMLNPAIFFNLALRTGEHYSQDAQIEILPLPAAGRPTDFSGAVGEFTLSLAADRQKLLQNTPITFTLTLAGTGNFQAVDNIKLPLPADFELYEATTNGKGANPVGGKRDLESQKVFQVVAIPRKAGKFTVPSMSWSYFDPKTEKYAALSTKPLDLEVEENNNPATTNNNYLEHNESTAPAAPTEEFRYLKPINLSAGPSKMGKTLGFIAFFLLAGNLLSAFRLIKGRYRGFFRLVQGVDPFAKAKFSLLQAKGIRDGEWQAGLEEVLLLIYQIMLNTNPHALTKNELEESWRARGLPAPLFQRIHSLLEEIDRQRFSSEKLLGTGTNEVRSRLTRETESVLAEATRIKKG